MEPPGNTVSGRKGFLSNFKYGLGGVISAIVLLVIIFFLLNALKVVNFSSFFGDKSGRYRLASKDIGGIPDQFGPFYAKGEKDPIIEIGIFDNFEDIPGTSDFYIVFHNPSTKKQQKGRILVSPSRLTSFEGGKDDKDFTNITKLNVENLSKAGTEKESENIGTFFDLGKSYALKIIKKGDVVKVKYISSSVEEAKETNKKIKIDELGFPALIAVSIRRNNGMSDLKQGLK